MFTDPRMLKGWITELTPTDVSEVLTDFLLKNHMLLVFRRKTKNFSALSAYPNNVCQC